MKGMGDDSVDVVITSPPYNRKSNVKYAKYNDTLKDVEYEKLLHSSIEECMRISKGFVFYNIQKTYYNKNQVYSLFEKYKEVLVENIVWVKKNPAPATGVSITNAYEFILVFNKNKKSLKSNKTYTKNILITSVYSNNPYKEVHKAVMKPEVVKYIIENFTKEGDIILDPFMGVATTGEVSLINKRHFIGIELIKDYFEISKQRLENIKTIE